MNPSEFKSLFLSQSYEDAWNDYKKSMTSRRAVPWDFVVLTASNEDQADIFRREINWRKKDGVLPERTEYLVVSDPGGKRVGSGGATLNVLKTLSEKTPDFAQKRTMVIHSGGDSKRVPQYSVCGKLFSPVPRELPDGRASTLFDELVISMSAMASRIKEGMLVLSGDVLILFNPLQIDAQLKGAAAISVKAEAKVGTGHGVFLNDGNGEVSKFLHKQSRQMLEKSGAVNARGMVDIDTGAVLMDSDILNALFSLICDDEDERTVDPVKFEAFVNERCRISFYGDFLYPLAKSATLEEYYKETPEGEMSDELLNCRTKIWRALHDYTFKLFSVSPAQFIHFGTSGELLSLLARQVGDYAPLGWKKQVNSFCPGTEAAVYHSVVEERAIVPQDSFVEYSHIHNRVKVGHNCIISGVELTSGEIPDNTVVHGLVLRDGRFVARVYGIEDNPKKYIEGLSGRMTLWEAPLFPVCGSMKEAVAGSLKIFLQRRKTDRIDIDKIADGREMISLEGSFSMADGAALLDFKGKLEDRILLARIKRNIALGEPESVSIAMFERINLSQRLFSYLLSSATSAEFSDKIRIFHLLSSVMENKNMSFDEVDSESVADLCYSEIGASILSAALKNVPDGKMYAFVKDEANVSLPVRVNWGGGWTDTPPQCMEQGGLVINTAITLNGKQPIHVTVKKMKERGVFFESADLGVTGSARSVDDIRDCRNPGDFFALHKAALLATGVIPLKGEASIESICKKLGGGIFLSTYVEGIPKGSGLGTSSILAAAAVKAVFEIFGVQLPKEETYGVVLAMEQLMSTGGGWQDQVGGLCPGIKRVTSRPGFDQKLNVEPLNIPVNTKHELAERFVLIYTGQRRLARNLLREIIGSYIEGRKETVEALYEMKILTEQMDFALSNDKFEKFADLMNRHWEVSKKLDMGCTNTCIESIFGACEDLIAGRFIAGAGGGGFLQVILKKGVSKQQLADRIDEIFGDSGVSVWYPEIVW